VLGSAAFATWAWPRGRHPEDVVMPKRGTR
jgi:hypothetical protein